MCEVQITSGRKGVFFLLGEKKSRRRTQMERPSFNINAKEFPRVFEGLFGVFRAWLRQKAIFIGSAGFLQLRSGAFTFRGYDCMSFDSFECCTAPTGNPRKPSFSGLRFVTCIPTLYSIPGAEPDMQPVQDCVSRVVISHRPNVVQITAQQCESQRCEFKSNRALHRAHAGNERGMQVTSVIPREIIAVLMISDDVALIRSCRSN